MKKRYGFIFLFLSLCLSSCHSSSSPSLSSANEMKTTTNSEANTEMTLLFKIDGEEVPITWEKNESVASLTKLAKDGLTLHLSRYGGFEQTGPIGHTLPSFDTYISVIPGDVVLYNSNQISLFYNSNQWQYTKLGHINLDKEDLTNRLDKNSVTILISTK